MATGEWSRTSFWADNDNFRRVIIHRADSLHLACEQRPAGTLDRGA